MKIATQTIFIKQLGYQLILDESKLIIGINLVLGKKILVKKRYDVPVSILSQKELNKFADEFVKDSLSSLNK